VKREADGYKKECNLLEEKLNQQEEVAKEDQEKELEL